VVTEVSRLGRTTAEVLLLADGLREREVRLRILNLGMDTATPAGGLVLTLMAGLAKFERQLLRERQRRGIEAARQRGKHLGRPPLLDSIHAKAAIERLLAGEGPAQGMLSKMSDVFQTILFAGLVGRLQHQGPRVRGGRRRPPVGPEGDR
jgi:DNA invertase Pin-like site-specific DNA recombinase